MFLADGRLSRPLVCLSIDVEWAHPLVLADMIGEIEARGITATFFVTHEGVEVPGHEAALHPNLKRGRSGRPSRDGDETDDDMYRRVVRETLSFAPGAIGVRAHSLFFDTALLAVYSECGIAYDSSYALQLVDGLRPFRLAHDMVELPVYYMDHLDLLTGIGGLDPRALRLDEPGLKVLDFHPNMVFVNAPTDGFYRRSKAHYHDPEALARMRHPGRGVRRMFLEVLDLVASRGLATATLGEVDRAWRKATGLTVGQPST